MSSRKSRVFALSLGQGLTMVAQVVFQMVAARVLSLQDMATYRQTLLVYNFVVPMLSMGIPGAMYYFLSGATERRRGIILDNMALLAVAGAAFSGFLLFGGSDWLALRFNNPELSHSLRAFVLYPLISFPSLSLTAVLVICDRVNLSVALNVMLNFLLTSALIVSCVWSRGFMWPIYIKVVFAAITTLVLCITVFKVVKDGFDVPRLGNMWKVIKFSVPLGLAGMLGTISVQLSNIIVSCFCSPEEFAIYSSGALEIPFIGMITGSMATIVMADMTKLVKENRMVEAIALFRKSASYSAMLLFPIMAFLLVEAEDFMCVMYSEKYLASAIPFTIYLFVIPLRIVYYQSAFVAIGKTAAVFWRTLIGLAFDIVLVLGCTYFWGYMGAAAGTVLSSWVWGVPYNLIYLSRHYQCSWLDFFPWMKLLKILVVSAISTLATFAVTTVKSNSAVGLFAGALAFAIVYFPSCLYFLPECKEMMVIVKERKKR